MDQHIEKASTRTRLLPVFFSAAERSILFRTALSTKLFTATSGVLSLLKLTTSSLTTRVGVSSSRESPGRSPTPTGFYGYAPSPSLR